MKTIGLLGGMSWESTLEYYRLLNDGVKKRKGGLHSAPILLHSVDFGPIERLMRKGDWQQIEIILGAAAMGLERAGADFFLICTNTMHKLAPQLQQKVDIPLLHIADAAAEVLLEYNMKRVGLLGTTFTMEQDFYRTRLQQQYGLDVLVPGERDRGSINRIIFEELCCGEVLDGSRSTYLRIIADLEKEGAEAVLLGCTEIGLLIHQNDVNIPLFDTTPIHVAKALDYGFAE